MDLKRIWITISSKWRILLIVLAPAAMLCTLAVMLIPGPVASDDGRADLTGVDFSHNQLVSLNGQWEFYWNKLLTPEDFSFAQKPQPDSFMNVPGVWSDRSGTDYTHQGVATYRMVLRYPAALKDPALRIQNVATAYKLYANGRLVSEVGNASDDKAAFREAEQTRIIDLPKDAQEIALVIQAANLNYATGGLRAGPVFGSKQVLEQQKMILLVLQTLFIGGVFIFGLHYFAQFLLHNKNKPALFFSLLCIITVLRSLLWGETPLMIFFPDASFDFRMYLNYLTGYNYVPIVILFVHGVYP
ncbi:MAG TPA: hypothetical protein VN381_15995, partial [Anaerovoracaceae bacterium]|nr:hypothetical protein [Anaerovoracaceae bacterium]